MLDSGRGKRGERVDPRERKRREERGLGGETGREGVRQKEREKSRTREPASRLEG